MSSHKWSIIALLTRSRTEPNNRYNKKKKKRRWLFRKAESQSSLQDTRMYDQFGGPFGPDGIQSSFEVSPYEDLSPNSFFTEKGVQRDVDFQRSKKPSSSLAPPLPSSHMSPVTDYPDFSLPENAAYQRPSLRNIFDVQNRNSSGGERNVTTPSTRTSSSNVVGYGPDNEEEEEEDDDDDDDDDDVIDIASPYEEDHLKPPLPRVSKSKNKVLTPKTSGTSVKSDRVFNNREGRRSLTEESAVPSAVYSEAYADNRVKRHGRERQPQFPYYPPFPPFMYPPHLQPRPHHPHKKHEGKMFHHYYGPPPPPGSNYMPHHFPPHHPPHGLRSPPHDSPPHDSPPHGSPPHGSPPRVSPPRGSSPYGYPPHMMMYGPPYAPRGQLPPPPFPGYYPPPFFPPVPEEAKRGGDAKKRHKRRQRSKDKMKEDFNYGYGPNEEQLEIGGDSLGQLDDDDDAPKGLDKFLY